jgi:hypothetical protein
MRAFIGFVFLCMTLSALAQPGKVVDRIIGVVGNEIILQSDLESSILEMTEGKGSDDAAMRCQVYYRTTFNGVVHMLPTIFPTLLESPMDEKPSIRFSGYRA